MFRDWPAALYPTPVTARPPAGRAGRGGFADGKGRPCTQPFLVEAEKGGSRLSPQRNASPAPLGNPVAPSSVTFGDSFPPRGSLRRWYDSAKKSFLTQPLLPQNANPNQGTQMGTVLAPLPEQCATTAKTSEWQRAGYKTGGPGGLPPALFLPISREKWGPRRAGGPPGALRPEASEKPRPPEGYVVPYQAPARDRAGTHVAGSTLRWFQRNRLPMTEAPGPSGATPTPSGQMKEKPPGKGSRFCASCSFFAPSRKNP